jgi:hypothetical protein
VTGFGQETGRGGRAIVGPHLERSEGIVKEALGKARPVAIWALTAVVAFAALSALINLLFIDNRAGEFGFANSAAFAFRPGDGVLAGIAAGLVLVLVAYGPAVNGETRVAVAIVGISIAVLLVVGVVSFFSALVADHPSGLSQALYVIGQLVALAFLAAVGLAVVHAARSADMTRPRPAAPTYPGYGQMYGQAPYGYGGQPYRQPPQQPAAGQYGGPYATPPPGQYPGQQPHAPYGGPPAQPMHGPYGQPGPQGQPGQPPPPYGTSAPYGQPGPGQGPGPQPTPSMSYPPGQPIRPQPYEHQPYPPPPFTQPSQPPSYPRDPEGDAALATPAEGTEQTEMFDVPPAEPPRVDDSDEGERPPV